jgi:hypothetical protein
MWLAKRALRSPAYAECTASQMMAMFGWTDPKVPAHYIAQANAKSLVSLAWTGCRVRPERIAR